ncbi:MAG: sensor histidine kinase [Polyangiales bacterium]
MGDLCRAIVDEARSAHPDRVIELAIDDDPKASLDHDRFGQVVANLVANGLAHGSATAPLSIAVRRVDGDVEVSVHNEGPEIPADLVPHLFEPFRRAEGKPRARGLGLGLYIAERIVVAHGGRIDVESSATHGTTFRVRVPTVQS